MFAEAYRVLRPGACCSSPTSPTASPARSRGVRDRPVDRLHRRRACPSTTGAPRSAPPGSTTSASVSSTRSVGRRRAQRPRLRRGRPRVPRPPTDVQTVRPAGMMATVTASRRVVDEGLGHSSYVVGSVTARPWWSTRPVPRPSGRLAADRGWRIAWTADTHSHADYISGSPELAADGATFLASAGAGLEVAHRPGRAWRVESSSPRRRPAGDRHARPHARPPRLPARRGRATRRRCSRVGR